VVPIVRAPALGRLVVAVALVAAVGGTSFVFGRVTAPGQTSEAIRTQIVPTTTPASASPSHTTPKEDVIAFARSSCVLGVNALFTSVVTFAPRDPNGDAQAAWMAQTALVEALSKTDRNPTVQSLRSAWLDSAVRIRDLLLQKLALQGTPSRDSVTRQIGEEYDREAITLAAIERLQLEYGVAPSDYTPPGGCKT